MSLVIEIRSAFVAKVRDFEQESKNGSPTNNGSRTALRALEEAVEEQLGVGKTADDIRAQLRPHGFTSPTLTEVMKLVGEVSQKKLTRSQSV